jgi:hypothetical protein
MRPLGAGEARAVFLFPGGAQSCVEMEGDMPDALIVSDARVERSILLIRGRKVLLDADLAELYGVSTKVLNQAIKRNRQRFPPDFLFQLDEQEVVSMRSQSVTASNPAGLVRSQIATASKSNIRYLPYAFSEHGVIMAASVLNTQRAMEVSVYVVRVFVKLRELAVNNLEIMDKLAQIERRLVGHDKAIAGLFDAIRQLMTLPVPAHKRRKIGFRGEE